MAEVSAQFKRMHLVKVSTNTNVIMQYRQVKFNIHFTQPPLHALFSAGDAGIDSWFFQTLPAPVQSQCMPSTTLPAFPIVAD